MSEEKKCKTGSKAIEIKSKKSGGKKVSEKKESREFRERMSLIEAQKEADKLRHNQKMIELEFDRATSKLIHEQILERGRIQRAEDRKLFWEKKNWRGN